MKIYVEAWIPYIDFDFNLAKWKFKGWVNEKQLEIVTNMIENHVKELNKEAGLA